MNNNKISIRYNLPPSSQDEREDGFRLERDFILRSVSNSPFPSDFLLLSSDMARESCEVEAEEFERETADEARVDFFLRRAWSEEVRADGVGEDWRDADEGSR